MKTVQFSSVSPCPFLGPCCLCCWYTNGCTGIFKTHFLVYFAMPATHYKHPTTVFQADSGHDTAIDHVFRLRVEVWIVGSQNEIRVKCVAQRMAVFTKACVGETAALVFLWLFNSLCLFRAFERCSCCFWPVTVVINMNSLCREISSVWRNQRQVLCSARHKPLQPKPALIHADTSPQGTVVYKVHMLESWIL